MPLECLCRLVNASIEARVTGITTAATSSKKNTDAADSSSQHAAPRERDSDSITEVGTANSSDTPSVLIAYVELLRVLVARLAAGASPKIGAVVGDSGSSDHAGGAWAAMQALDVGALFG